MGAPLGGMPTPWLPLRQPLPGRVSVFCLPFAGGGASAYRSWLDAAPPSLQICPVQLPGRENRLREPAHRRMGALVAELAEALAPHLHQPYLLFGHSMGASIAHELARHLVLDRGDPPPAHLVLSARRPPDEASPRRPIHALPDPAFIDELRHLRGTPEAVLADAELMALLLPLLRADFELIETHQRAPAQDLALPCTVVGGHQDELSEASLRGWGRHLRPPPELRLIDGGHFYLHDQRHTLLELLAHRAAQAQNSHQTDFRPLL